MRNFHFLILIALIVGCQSSKNMLSAEWVKPNYSPRTFAKLAVIVVSKDYEIRKEAERAIAHNLNKNGQNTVEGTSFLPLNSNESDWKPESVAQKLKQNQIDGALVVGLVNTRDRQVYNQGENIVYPSGYVRVGRNIYRTYGQVQTPGYYTHEKEYIIESNLYDLEQSSTNKKDALVWTGQSSVGSYPSLRQASNSYGKRLVRHLMENNSILLSNSQ